MATQFMRPLSECETSFLEVLLDRFELTRNGKGVRLDVRFGDSTQAVWNRNGIRQVRRAIKRFDRRADVLQQRLDEFLLQERNRRLVVDEPGFPFRYASGGTLPVVRMGGQDFYCLFYRDIHPVGWNIANGGCVSRAELRQPLRAAERELREEVVIYDQKNRLRYVFAGEAGQPIDLPEFATARQVWADLLRIDVSEYAEHQVPLKWLPGPDEVRVEADGLSPSKSMGCFLNINALDFGIEIDRIAKLGVDEDAVILDGELCNDQPINQVVGLFDVARLNREIALGNTQFLPDRIYWNGRRYPSRLFERTLHDGYFKQRRFRKAMASRQEYKKAREKFDLCPVTRRIIARYMGIGSDEQPSRCDVGVFISHPSEDVRPARCVFEWCAGRGLQPFLSEESINRSNFGAVIDDAIDSAQHMIVVASRPERLLKQWVQFEWRRFQGDILNGRKPYSQIVPFISGFDPKDLPGALRSHNAVIFSPKRPQHALPQLERFFR